MQILRIPIIIEIRSEENVVSPPLLIEEIRQNIQAIDDSIMVSVRCSGTVTIGRN